MAGKLKDSDDPFILFSKWMADAEKAEPNDPNAAALATADSSGNPNVRMVLVKCFDNNGFVFYTNLESQKGHELDKNPHAALCFHWKSLERQIRIRGKVEPVKQDDADIYFSSRARLSKIGAWASRQSQVLESRFALEKAVAYYTAKYAAGEIPRPPHWSGFCVAPEEMEFWQSGKYRLHKRVLFSRDEDGWSKSLLYP